MKTTNMKVSIHGDTEDPIFGDDALDIELKDEGGGMFLVLSKESGSIALDFSEWKHVVEAVYKLIDQPGVK